MQRLGVIDGMRGYFLVFMFLTHLTFSGGYLLVRVNHAELGFVQDAQGFVFLSGLLVGMVYGRRMLKHGFGAASGALWRRAAELYAYTIACVVVVLLLREALPGAAWLWRGWLGGLGDGGLPFRVAGAALLYQPTFLDILPQYIVYMIVAPPLLWMALSERWLWVAVGSVILWLAIQTGVHLPLVDAIDAGLSHFNSELSLRVAFNVLAWQLIFFGGMVIGARAAAGKLNVGAIFDPKKTLIVKAFAASLVFFLLFRLGFTFELVPEIVMKRFQVYENRPEFSLVFLVNFVLLAYVMAWLLVAGPQAEHAWVRRVAGALHFVFGLSFLRLLGRHSLQIYAWHVVLVYVLFWIDWRIGPQGEVAKTLIAFMGIGLLSLPAVYREWRGSRRARAVAG